MTQESKISRIHISLPAIQDIAVKGVRRTAVFMGLGVNAATNPEFTQYELTNFTHLRFIEQNPSESTLKNFQDEFGRWIVSNGIRELIETFCVFLDEINLACLWIDVISKQTSSDNINKTNSNFRRLGLEKKFSSLLHAFGIKIDQAEYLISINQVRNCLTHRRGIVGIEDCINTEELIVKWKGIDIYIQNPSSEKIPLFPLREGGVLLEKDGKINMEIKERTKTVPLKSIITFTPKELAEICHYVLLVTDEVVKATEDYAIKQGIPIIKSEKVAT
jgi:hypothetical protein